MVGHRQRIAELHAECQPFLRCHPLELPDQLDRALVLQIVLKDRVGDVNAAVAQIVVQDAHDPVLPQQGGIQLYIGVESLLLQQIAADRLDLVGGTAVHGG